MLIAAGDLDELVGSRLQPVANISDQEIEITLTAHQRRQRLALDRRGSREDHRLDAAHEFPPAYWRRQLGEFAIQHRGGFGAPAHA